MSKAELSKKLVELTTELGDTVVLQCEIGLSIMGICSEIIESLEGLEDLDTELRI